MSTHAGRKFDVVGVGLACVDLVMKVPRIPECDETVLGYLFEKHYGGVVANCLVGLARLGAKTTFIGKVGDDEYGKAILEEFKKEGVDVNHAVMQKGGVSPLSFILVDDQGFRTIAHFPGVSSLLSPKELSSQCIIDAKVLHLNAVGAEAAIWAAKMAREVGTMVSFDMSAPIEFFEKIGIAKAEDLRHLIKLSDVFIPCKPAARSFTGKNNLEKAAKYLLKLGPNIVAITLGNKGCIIATKKRAIMKPAYKVRALDTTGAGDAFHAGFIYGLLRRWSLEKTAEFANAVAALKCTKVGARAGLPTLEGVEDFLSSGPELAT